MVNTINHPVEPSTTPVSNSGCDATISVSGNATSSFATLDSVTLDLNGTTKNIPGSEINNGDYSSNMEGGKCNDGSCSYPDNLLISTAHWEFGGVYYDEEDSVEFEILCESQSSSSQKPFSKLGPTADPDFRDHKIDSPIPVEPIEEMDGWLHFKNVLNHHPSGQGVVLHYEGYPLLGERMGAYSDNVAWRPHGSQQEIIFSPSGTLQVASAGIKIGAWHLNDDLPPIIKSLTKFVRIGRDPYRFLGVFKEAVCVTQPIRLKHRDQNCQVVTAQQKLNPNLFALDPETPIFVQVNDSFNSQAMHTGEINLWVRVD